MKVSVDEKFRDGIILNRKMTAEEWATFEGCAIVRSLKGARMKLRLNCAGDSQPFLCWTDICAKYVQSIFSNTFYMVCSYAPTGGGVKPDERSMVNGCGGK
jgi:hypothetical protein